MPLEDLLNSRLVCKEWKMLLGAQVTAVQLPADLWQYSTPQQLCRLQKLMSNFNFIKVVRLQYDKGHGMDSPAIGTAMKAFATVSSFNGLHIKSVVHPQHWPCVLDSLATLAGKLRSLCLEDICLPAGDSMQSITVLTALTDLTIHSPLFSRLHPDHLCAIATLNCLSQLRLAFRAVEGTIHHPLPLDPLTALCRLTELEVEYTGRSSEFIRLCVPLLSTQPRNGAC